jgi:hypothetical protein
MKKLMKIKTMRRVAHESTEIQPARATQTLRHGRRIQGHFEGPLGVGQHTLALLFRTSLLGLDFRFDLPEAAATARQ